jgi:hypothetical protein
MTFISTTNCWLHQDTKAILFRCNLSMRAGMFGTNVEKAACGQRYRSKLRSRPTDCYDFRSDARTKCLIQATTRPAALKSDARRWARRLASAFQ